MGWYLKDFHGNEIEVTDMNDWLDSGLMWISIVTWYLMDCHGNEIEVP